MKERRLFLTLTALNAAMLFLSLAGFRTTAAEGIAPVLKARGFEIVDERGRVRAEIKVLPRDPNVKMPDGSTGYPETVLLRLIDSTGAPNVKIAATEDGSGISLGGDSNPTNIQLLARGSTTSLKLINSDGKQTLLKP
jgi:hypothetical protein